MIAQARRRWIGSRQPAAAGQAGRRGKDGGTTPSGEGEGRREWLAQALRYSAVGIFNTVLDASVYFLLTHFLGLGGLKVLAKAISYGAGTLNSFHWNRSWTFRSKVRALATFVPFLVVSLMALGLNAVAMYLSLELFSQREMPAFVAATAATLLWNFAVTKFVIFRR